MVYWPISLKMSFLYIFPRQQRILEQMGAATREAQPLRAVPVALRLVVGHLAFGKALERRLEVHVRSSGSWWAGAHDVMDYTSGAWWISLFAEFMLDMLECHTFGQEMVKSVREKVHLHCIFFLPVILPSLGQFSPQFPKVHRVLLCSCWLQLGLDVHYQLHPLFALERVLGTGSEGWCNTQESRTTKTGKKSLKDNASSPGFFNHAKNRKASVIQQL